MQLISRTIPIKPATKNPFVLCPIGDIQYTGKKGATAMNLLKRHIDRCLEMDGYFIGLGDYLDFASPSNRARLAAANLYDTALDQIDDMARDLVNELYEEVLKPTTGRWLMLLHGHHFHQFKTGDNTDTYLCKLLKAEFAGTCAYLRLNFEYGKTEKRKASAFPMTIWAHHGCGGGGKVGTPITKLENLSTYWDADIFLMGHTTKRPAAVFNRITPEWHKDGYYLRDRTVFLVNTGGFAKGYMENSKQGSTPMGGYVEQGMLNPAALGAPIISIYHHQSYPKDKNFSGWKITSEIKVEI